MTQSLRDQYPLRLIIGNEDCTFLLDDGFTFSNVDPGGYEAASFAIPRDMPNTLRGQNVRLDCGLGVAWEGRVQQIQRSLGSRTQIMCEGYGAILKDNASSMVFVDRDLTRWTSPSYARQIFLLTNNLNQGSFAVAADSSGQPALIETISGSWTGSFFPSVEAWYDAGPENLIGEIYYGVNLTSTIAGTWNVRLVVDQDNDTGNAAFQFTSVTPPAQGYWTPPANYRFGILQFSAAFQPGGADGAQADNAWEFMAVYGTHGLTQRGGPPAGFYPSDIATWIIQQAPGLQPGVIQTTDASGYIVEHSAYYTPTNLDQMMNDMAKTQGWHWGVWESLSPLTGNSAPRCDFRPRAQPGAWTAFCRRDDCDTLDLREDVSQQYNRALVNFTDVAGVPGAAIVTADNPILDEAGIGQRTVVLNGGTMTQATAAIFGLEALAITNIQARVAGSADINSLIYGPSAPMPAWLLKSGIDRLQIADVPSFDAFGQMSDFPISRVECSVSSSGMNTSVELGSGGNLVETLQARTAAATVLAAQGGV